MSDRIADFAEAERRASLVDGTAFEISVVVSPVGQYVYSLEEEAMRIASYGFNAQQNAEGFWVDPYSQKQLVAVLVGDITTAYTARTRDTQQFGAAYRVGVLREE